MKILVIQTARIGDMVCTTPVFREIKKHFPQSKLVVLCTAKTEPIIRHNKNINEIIVYNLNQFQGFRKTFSLLKKIRSYKFDVSIAITPGTLHYLLPFFAAIPKRIATIIPGQSWRYYFLSIFNSHTLQYQIDTLALKHYLNLLQFIGVKEYSLKKEVFPDENSLKKAGEFLRDNNLSEDDFLVGVNPTAGNKFKQWAPEKFAKLADLIIQKYHCKIILLGGPQDAEALKNVASQMVEKPIVTFGEFSLSELPALLQQVKVYISVDSGPLYIANALDIPVIDIVGPCSIRDQVPVYEKCAVVKIENLDCWPCTFVGKTRRDCKVGHFKCLKDLRVEDVFSAFEKGIMSKYYQK